MIPTSPSGERVPSPSLAAYGEIRRRADPAGWTNDIQATACQQCWNSIQKNHGINVCTLMSMMSEKS